jgi:cation diffusion facilitator family transporter
MSDCDCHIEIQDASQKSVLVKLLAINGLMFTFEALLGWYAQSTGLIADSADMLADAIIYGIGLYAVGRSARHKARAALISGGFQGLIALLILADVVRRAVLGSEPTSLLMMGVGLVALAANTWCLYLISAHREGEVHMRASWIFSKNDVIANTGVILAGVLVWLTGSRWPDLAIGTLIALVVLRGALHIVQDARAEGQSDSPSCRGGEDCG